MGQVTAHIPDKSISSLKITVDGLMDVTTITKSDGTWSKTFDNDMVLIFTPTVAEGYIFDHWDIYTGNGGAKLGTSKNNPYKYTVDDQGIWIVPFGVKIEEEEIWNYSIARQIGTLTDDYSLPYGGDSLEVGLVKVYSVSFDKTGTATFYSTGSTDTYGFLSTSLSFNNSSGRPRTSIAEDDNSGSRSNFEFSASVQKDTIYYIWVRGIEFYDEGDYNLYITVPTGEEEPEDPIIPTGDGGVYIYNNGWKKATPYIYVNGWKKATPYIYVNGWKKCL